MRKMKDSGIAWIGEIPEEWTVAPLKHLVNITMGQSPDSADVSDDGEIPFMQGNADFGTQYPSPHLYCDNAKKMCDAGDILLSVRAPVGALNLADRTYGIGRGLCAIQARDLHRDFLYFALMTLGGAFDYLSNGSTFDAITTSDLKNIQISVPPRDEQTKISETLQEKFSEIGNAINEMRRLIDKLALYKQSLITETVTKGLHPEAARKDSGVSWIGEIPRTSIVVPLTKKIAQIVDYRGKTPEKVNDGIFLVTAKNIKDGIIDYALSQEYIRPEDYDTVMSRGKPKIGDVLFTTEAPLGEVANVDREDIALAQRVIKFTPTEEANPYYLKYWMMHQGFQQFLQSLSTGSTAAGIKASKLFMLKMVLHPLDEQRKIVSFLDAKCAAIDADIARRRKLIERLSAYRRSLIYEVVTGKREVV